MPMAQFRIFSAQSVAQIRLRLAGVNKLGNPFSKFCGGGHNQIKIYDKVLALSMDSHYNLQAYCIIAYGKYNTGPRNCKNFGGKGG